MTRTARSALALLFMAAAAVAGQSEDEMNGFIVDNTISHAGHAFYYSFTDRLRATSRLDFNLVVRERPSARWGSLVTVEYQQQVVYRRFLPPNIVAMEDVAREAADLVRTEVVQRKLTQMLQDTQDLERDEL